MNLTLPEAVAYHRILWRKIGDYILNLDPYTVNEIELSEIKGYLVREIMFESSILNDCFLCEYAESIRMRSHNFLDRCKVCPLLDQQEPGVISCLNELYDTFRYETSAFLEFRFYPDAEIYRKTAYDLAIKIAELPIVNWSSVL